MSLPRIAIFLSFMLFTTACSSSKDNAEDSVIDEGDQSDQGVQGETSYRVSFTDQWNAVNFPTNFPSSRHFSGLVGATHNEQVIFWELGQTATAGIRSMAETGAKGDLQDKINNAFDEGKSDQLLSGGGIGGSPSSVSLNFEINKDYPLVTLVSMVAPSPDWFVGVAGLDLRGTDGEFVQSLLVPLVVYDAGTDSGLRFTSSNSASEGEVITRLNCEINDCDFVQGIHRDSAASVTTIGSFLFERTQ